jgi:uncharacterized membrane protein
MRGALPRPTRRLIGAGVLGFAFGGFFDGILLHQVLQWHHFLSLVPGEAFRDIRVQILADGLFHVAVYVLAALGLWLLWRSSPRPEAGERALLGAATLGFGVWQLADVGLIHWIVGIHRIRVDVPNPLLWDIGWLVVFGLPALLLGFRLLRNPSDPPSPDRRRPAAALLSVAVLAGGIVGALPVGQPGATIVVFRPDVTPPQSFAAVAAVDGRVMWSDPTGQVLALDLPDGANPWRLYTLGAIMVGGAGPLAACAPRLRL